MIRAVVVELARFARRNTLAAAGGLVGVLIVVVAVAAPLLAPRDPLKADFRRMNKPPDAQSLLGTDQVGRDTAPAPRSSSRSRPSSSARPSARCGASRVATCAGGSTS